MLNKKLICYPTRSEQIYINLQKYKQTIASKEKSVSIITLNTQLTFNGLYIHISTIKCIK